MWKSVKNFSTIWLKARPENQAIKGIVCKWKKLLDYKAGMIFTK